MAKSKKRPTKNKLNAFKMEAAQQVGVNIDSDNISAKDAGRVGGQMVKNMVNSYQKNGTSGKTQSSAKKKEQ